jgi:hypothetical protein
MMDEDGPGAIVRIWATWHGPGGGEFSDGTLRVYIDGQDQPAIEGPASKVIDQGLLAGPPLSEGVSPETPYAQRGHNLYLPIPYAKHCKVTYSTDVPVDIGAKTGEALYYQINYRTYNRGVDVESFSMHRLATAKEVVDAVNRALADGAPTAGDDWSKVAIAAELPAGASSEPIRIAGPAAVRSLECRLEADDLEQALRSTILEIVFDDERTVWCPIGDFFGTGYKHSRHQTWYTRVSDDGAMSCAWVMPLERNAVLRFHNVGAQPVRVVDGVLRHSPWQWDDRSLHFCAAWRQLTEADTRGKKDMTGQDAFDVNYVTVRGRGVYVGDALTICNGAAAWWGEGDEKIYVDGETFPSHFGTGTEDYYGYAWCRPEYFSSPFHAQPQGGGNLAGGYSVNSRFRSLDAIPFTKSIQFDMELWHWAGTKVNYAPTTFWYARPGATSNVEPDPATAARPVARVRTDLVPVFRAAGAVEGESLKVIENTGGKWSGDAQLWWIDGNVGDKLVLEFPAETTGRRRVLANVTKAADYAIVQLSVNGAPAEKLDRFHDTVAHDLVDLGACEIKEGSNRLVVEIVGANPKAIPRRMFGLDYIKVE